MIEGKTVAGEAAEEKVVEDTLAVGGKVWIRGCIILAAPWEAG